MSNIVKYKDELNSVPLRSFNSKELDLFFAICYKMKNKDVNKITFDFQDLKELSNYKYTAYDRFVEDIEGVYDKLIQLNIKIGTDTRFTKFVLFTEYSVDTEEETVAIQTNEKFKYILNQIEGGFTQFELREFTNLSSSYSKTAYRLLKQFRTSGYYITKTNDFRELFDIPKSYKMSDIDKRVLAPIKKELPEYFKNLKIAKLKGKGKRKRSIEYIEFKFKPETGIKNGKKTFRDKKTGEYYEKDIMDFTDKEIEKTFSGVKPLSENISKRKKMGLPAKGFSNKDIDEIYDAAMNKILESKSSMDIYGYVNYYWGSMKDRDGIKTPGAYLKTLLKNDYDNRLGQQTIL